LNNIGQRSIADYVQQWGSPASIALLDPHCELFSIPTIDGVIGYKMEPTCAVVFGDPVCSAKDTLALAQAFRDFCTTLYKNVAYVMASEQFKEVAKNLNYRCIITIGHEIVLNPHDNPKLRSGKDGSSLRNKCNYSQRLGIVVHEYTTYNPHIERAFEEIARTWIDHRSGPQIHMFSQIDMLTDRTNKRWFYATYQEKIVGVLMLNRIDAYAGWVINMLMLTPQAPNPTSEFILLSALDALRTEGCHYCSVGTMPTDSLTIEGLGRCSTWLAHNIFKVIRKAFKLHDRQRYWKKFHPEIKPTFLIFDKSRLRLRDAFGIMKTFNLKLIN
jgi:lysylphosphatidylglycerol synthetase-like protein (DUF2156 family)